MRLASHPAGGTPGAVGSNDLDPGEAGAEKPGTPKGHCRKHTSTRSSTQQGPGQVNGLDFISTDLEIEPQSKRIHRARKVIIKQQGTHSNFYLRLSLFAPRGAAGDTLGLDSREPWSEQGEERTGGMVQASRERPEPKGLPRRWQHAGRRAASYTGVDEHRSAARRIFFYHPPTLQKEILITDLE
eukprot:CAMPEP_0119473908 /NCGR_PEP_ID=MMETSP1344-20130328/5384_1 /TAXON_ID=236787 /ORGANISM="Florenciella parvula, Strain CCMP2471" /LENGTH=184 /DNA_ID=CAMNT_0007507115 /DNA_START=415 /DNA_END=970 /DNA_ORIENTATION=-